MNTARVVCVLAGGRSKRFGRSKIHLRINGEPILAWQARRLTENLEAQRWLSLAPDSDTTNPNPPGLDSYDRIIRDEAAHPGPLVAIRQLLHAARRDHVDLLFIAPADMPLLTSSHLAQLGALLEADRSKAFALGAWAAGPRAGQFEPLPLACRAQDASLLVDTLLAQGENAIRSIAALHGCAHLPLEHPRDRAAWLNVNRPDDVAEIEKLLGPDVRIE